MGTNVQRREILIENRLAAAIHGDGDAFYDLGICYQTGTAGAAVDLVEAHKWFNLAAVHGLLAAQDARSEVAVDMTRSQIAAAQAAARAWMGATRGNA